MTLLQYVGVVIHLFLGCVSTHVLSAISNDVFLCQMQNAHLQKCGPEDSVVWICVWPLTSLRHRNRSSPPHREGLLPRNYASLEPPLHFLHWQPVKNKQTKCATWSLSVSSNSAWSQGLCSAEASQYWVLATNIYLYISSVGFSFCTCSPTQIQWLGCIAVKLQDYYGSS